MKQKIHNSDEILYCSYCHGSIEQEETYVVTNGDKYHIDCWKQIHTPFLEDILNIEE